MFCKSDFKSWRHYLLREDFRSWILHSSGKLKPKKAPDHYWGSVDSHENTCCSGGHMTFCCAEIVIDSNIMSRMSIFWA